MTVIRIRTSYGWEDVSIQGPQGPVGPQGIQGPVGPQGPAGAIDQPALDAVPWRGYAFRMVSGEAAAATGTFIRCAQQNNNQYEDDEYFQGWKAGNSTAIKVMKAGFVRVFFQGYITGSTANVESRVQIALNGGGLAESRLTTPGTSLNISVGPILRACAVNDIFQFGSNGSGSCYQGTDGRFTHGWLEYLHT